MKELDPDIQEMLNERARTMALFTKDHRPMNMYTIYDASLEMPPGKLAAQCGHAFVNAYEKALQVCPARIPQYKGTGNGTKIIMYAKNRNQLIRAYRELVAAGVPCDLTIDRGDVLLPHFDGNPVITAIGFGPVYADEVKDITKRYTLTQVKLPQPPEK